MNAKPIERSLTEKVYCQSLHVGFRMDNGDSANTMALMNAIRAGEITLTNGKIIAQRICGETIRVSSKLPTLRIDFFDGDDFWAHKPNFNDNPKSVWNKFKN